MTTEITRWPFAVVWGIDPADPCAVRWKPNELGARWQHWRTFDTAQEAKEAMYENGTRQVMPEEVTP